MRDVMTLERTFSILLIAGALCALACEEDEAPEPGRFTLDTLVNFQDDTIISLANCIIGEPVSNVAPAFGYSNTQYPAFKPLTMNINVSNRTGTLFVYHNEHRIAQITTRFLMDVSANTNVPTPLAITNDTNTEARVTNISISNVLDEAFLAFSETVVNKIRLRKPQTVFPMRWDNEAGETYRTRYTFSDTNATLTIEYGVLYNKYEQFLTITLTPATQSR